MKWGLSQSRDHKAARKETLASGVYHETPREATGLRKALAIQEPSANPLPLLDAQMWLAEPRRKQESVPGGGRIAWTSSPPSPYLHFLNSPGSSLSGSPLLPAPIQALSPLPTLPALLTQSQPFLPPLWRLRAFCWSQSCLILC